eukprot:gene2332-4536_t
MHYSYTSYLKAKANFTTGHDALDPPNLFLSFMRSQSLSQDLCHPQSESSSIFPNSRIFNYSFILNTNIPLSGHPISWILMTLSPSCQLQLQTVASLTFS